MNGNLLRTLNEIDVDDLTLVGAKALNLAMLNGNHLTTPPGLVVTSQFFKAQISHYAYQPIWAGSPDVAVTEGALQFLSDFLKSNPLAPPLEAALQQRLSDLFPPEVQFFAVRSPAIDEDRRDPRLAGGVFTDLHCRPSFTSGHGVATNGALHDAVSSRVSPA